ncbi:DUF4365 domain-containing protein [bacterium]|nr:DUF4365 domain-containing protein [bacterium]
MSYAFVHAIAAHAGYSCDRPVKDRDSIDAVISARGLLLEDSILTSPIIQVQLKATACDPFETETSFSFQLPIKNYNDLRSHSMAPRLLVVVTLPLLKDEWLTMTDDALIAKRCAYWAKLKGLSDSSNTHTQSIVIQRNNRFTSSTLKQMMINASFQEELDRGL